MKNLFIMDTMILNFKKRELVADSKNDAIEIATKELFQINGDATQAFNNWKTERTGGITERDIKTFMLDYLAKRSKNAPGVGYIITMNPSVNDTRERPYQVRDVKGTGKRKYGTVWTWYDVETGNVICKVNTNKSDAKAAIKAAFKSGKFKGEAECVKSKDVIEGSAVVARAKYTPSKNTRKGTWVVFGIEA